MIMTIIAIIFLAAALSDVFSRAIVDSLFGGTMAEYKVSVHMH